MYAHPSKHEPCFVFTRIFFFFYPWKSWQCDSERHVLVHLNVFLNFERNILIFIIEIKLPYLDHLSLVGRIHTINNIIQWSAEGCSSRDANIWTWVHMVSAVQQVHYLSWSVTWDSRNTIICLYLTRIHKNAVQHYSRSKHLRVHLETVVYDWIFLNFKSLKWRY